MVDPYLNIDNDDWNADYPYESSWYGDVVWKKEHFLIWGKDFDGRRTEFCVSYKIILKHGLKNLSDLPFTDNQIYHDCWFYDWVEEFHPNAPRSFLPEKNCQTKVAA